MGFAKYSPPLKLSALRMSDLFDLPLRTIKNYLGLPKLCNRTLSRWRHLFIETHTVIPNPQNYQQRGRKRSIAVDGEIFLEGCLMDNSTLYRSELRLKLYHRTGIWKSLSSIQNILNDRLEMSCKQTRRLHQKRSAKKRAEFTYRIAHYPPYYLVFADESCVSQRSSERRNGWARVGQRPERVVAKINGKNYSCLPFVTITGLMQCVVKVGSFKRKQFIWVLRHLVVLL